MKNYALALALAIGLSPAVATAAIITDGNVSLGVDTLGQLNVGGGVADVVGQTAVGVRWIDPSGTQYESTSHGCLCEGWGLAVGGSSGYANNSVGTAGLTSVSFVNDATTATSVVQITGTAVQVTHSFSLAAETNDLYRVRVTVANTGTTDATGLIYRRVMDWDASPTPFDEYVTIQGTGTTSLLIGSSNDGFASSNPLSGALGTIAVGCAGVLTDFTACGPADHGAGFDFGLADLAGGESYSFDIFYGGAANKAAALTALGAVGAELYSMGWSSLDPDQNGRSDAGAVTPTFIFAFKGVGGTVIVPPNPPAVPLPAAGWMLLAGMGALAASRRRRKAA